MASARHETRAAAGIVSMAPIELVAMALVIALSISRVFGVWGCP